MIGPMLQTHQDHLRALADLGEFAENPDVPNCPDHTLDGASWIFSVFA
ncbi:hypothetical protein Q4543_24320 [Salipiger sp. 1_MG-2023]|nr:hypothetical protein [Salipiger sp. 1_MG-2023]MDO6588572.1 hypothetical protein [Salipiger sp. 1_MG-2023]